MNARILVVEDEEDIRHLVTLGLKREGFECVGVETSEDAQISIEGNKGYDLVLLDWMLPGGSGVEFLRKIRKEGNIIPVIMLTARGESLDTVVGLESGADDYISKPFEMDVLIARVRSVLRRAKIKETENAATKSPEEFTIGKLKVNVPAYEAYCGSEKLELTHSEFKLLSAMARSQGRVLTRKQLIAEVQGEGITVIDRAIDTHIFGLRKKLGSCGDIVETIRGVGYRIHG